MSHRFFYFFFFYFITQCSFAAVMDRYTFDNQKDADRFNSLTKEIRCVVCQNQNIADSEAPLAQDLRDKISQMVKEKKSNEIIKNFLVKRYGEFILLQPLFNKSTILLWIFPLAGLGFIFLFFLKLRSVDN